MVLEADASRFTASRGRPISADLLRASGAGPAPRRVAPRARRALDWPLPGNRRHAADHRLVRIFASQAQGDPLRAAPAMAALARADRLARVPAGAGARRDPLPRDPGVAGGRGD